jgi:tetratricopeptide (TPR) repeat protein
MGLTLYMKTKTKGKVLIFLLNVLILVFASCKSNNNKEIASSGDPAIDQLTNEINNNQKDASLYFQRAQLYYDKKIYDHAISDLQYAIKIDSLNPQYRHLISDAYLNYGHAQEAEAALNEVLRLYPQRIPTLLKMAELKYILEEYDGSIWTINEVVKLDPQNAEAYFMLGINFLAIKDIPRAINSFQTAVELDSKLTDAWIYLGELYEEKKDPKALQYYNSAILSNPESMQAKHAKAFYLQNHKDIPGAIELYRNIIMEDKSYTDAYLNSGILYLELDSLDRAYEQFNLMVGVAPTNYLGFYYRGIVNEKKGNKEAALKDYISANNLNNKDEKVEKALNTLKNH